MKSVPSMVTGLLVGPAIAFGVLSGAAHAASVKASDHWRGDHHGGMAWGHDHAAYYPDPRYNYNPDPRYYNAQDPRWENRWDAQQHRWYRRDPGDMRWYPYDPRDARWNNRWDAQQHRWYRWDPRVRRWNDWNPRGWHR